MIRAAPLLLLLAACAARSAEESPFAGRVAGEPVDCIALTPNTRPTIVDANTIAYRDGSRLWRTGPRGNCPLRPLDTLIVEVYGSQVCRNDRFRTLTPGTSIPSANCLFDRFTPYTSPDS